MANILKKKTFLPLDNSGRRRLKEGTVPTVFNWTVTTTSRRKVIRQVESATQTDESDGEGLDDESNQPYEGDTTHVPNISEELRQTKAQLLAVQAELAAARRDASAAQEELMRQKEQAAAELAIYKFGLERFSTDNDAIKFYTGFCAYNHLIFFYNFARPSAETMTYCYATGILENRPNVRAMQLIDELFMFLVRIKLGLFQQDLAHRFNLHMSTVSRKLTTWANYLYFSLAIK